MEINKEFKLKEVCPHDEFCGGCLYQGISYDEQLKIKENEARGYFETRDISVGKWDSISPCPEHARYEYRNKMEYTFGDLVKDGEMTLGMHKKGHFMSIVTVDNCQLVESDFNEILSFTLQFAKEKEYKKYHKRTHEGLMRNLIVRKGVKTSQLLINIVTASGDFSEEEFVEGILCLKLNNKVVGVLRTINDNIADAVNCQELRVLWGRDFYEEEVLGLKFKVSSFSFFQTNILAVERLYKDAINLIDNLEGKSVFDLYCGTGTISQLMALKAKSVVGIEIVEEAVEAAKENALINGLKNCKFISGDVHKVLQEVDELPDVIVVDPPRMGMTDKAVDKIVSYGVNQIIYISCNPKTLAINAERIVSNGYNLKYVRAYDNFPFTKHAECIALFIKNKILPNLFKID